MAISSAIQKKIETLKKGLNNKFITAAQKEKIKAQVEKLESQSKASAPKKATKPAASSSLTRLQKLVKNKKYGVYKGAGVDLKKDSDRPAKAIGKRTAKSGKTYYEYRANRIDVKQPPKKYPKLEKGGYMAKGGKVRSQEEFNKLVAEKEKLVKNLSPKEVAEMWNKNSNSPSKMTEEEGKMSNSRMYLADLLVENELTEAEHSKYFEKGGYMADGGETAKFEVDDVVYHKQHNTIGIVRLGEERGEVSTDADGNVNVDELEYYNPLKHESHKNAQIAPSTRKEIEERMLWKPFTERTSKLADGGRVKGRNNETGETYGVVIGSVKKSDENIEGGTEMNVRKGYSSRISEVKLVFDKNANLYEITDYGYALEGNYPDTSRGSGRNYNADKKETLEVLSKKYNPAFAKKLIELAKNPKMAEGGMTEHGLRIGDKITTDMFWDNEIIVENTKTNKRAVIDLETGKRKDEMEKGGEVDRERMYNFLKDDLAALEKAIEANNQEEIEKFFSYWNIHLKDLEPKTGSKRMYEFLKDDLVGLEAATKELPSSKEETDRFFSYWNIHLSSLEPKMEKGGYMADGGVTEKEVVESNADMVLSQIKAVKHHAEELSSVVSRKSNIEAWVVGKIERASTDLSDITHYLEGNKDKMSMGGTVRYYAHKMDKK